MKIYVATSFQNIFEARAVMDLLKREGHTITHDWTQEQVNPDWPQAQQDAYLQRCGATDFDGVVSADALVLINHKASRDAMAEFGVALGLSKAVYVLYPERRTSVFFHRASLFASLPALLDELEDL